MARYTLLIDYKLCFDCHACEVACKQENGLPVGVNWIKVITVGPRKINGGLFMEFIPMTCRHCSRPPCLEVCPVDGAISKLPNGAVVIDTALCIGCMACADACPFDAIDTDATKTIAGKCNMCVQLVEKGLKPSCVKACPSGAIQFGEVNELIAQRREENAQRMIARIAD